MNAQDQAELECAAILERQGDQAVLAGESGLAFFKAAQGILMPANRPWDHRTEFDRRLQAFQRLTDKIWTLDTNGRLARRSDRHLFTPKRDCAA